MLTVYRGGRGGGGGISFVLPTPVALATPETLCKEIGW